MLFLFVVALGGLGYFVVTRYNALQRMAQGIHEARANVVAAMQKKKDLINQLKEVAQTYEQHEKLSNLAVLNGEVEMAALAAGQPVGNVISHVGQLANRYPELKADRQYQQLMIELPVIEGDLETKRNHYNSQVRSYNTALTQLPVSLFAGSLGFKSVEYFQADSADSLDNIKSFTDDGTLVREMLANSSRRVASESARFGRALVEKGKEIQAARAADRPTPMLEGGTFGAANTGTSETQPPVS